MHNGHPANPNSGPHLQPNWTADVNSLIIKYKAKAGNDNNHSWGPGEGNAMRAPGETSHLLIASFTTHLYTEKNRLNVFK